MALENLPFSSDKSEKDYEIDSIVIHRNYVLKTLRWVVGGEGQLESDVECGVCVQLDGRIMTERSKAFNQPVTRLGIFMPPL